MKKKFLIALTAIFVLGLSIAVYAFNQTNNWAKTSDSCCAKSDACPMKGKNSQVTDAQTNASCCDKDDCCCKGDSCPMKSQGEKASAGGDSCPMKDKETQATTTDMKNVTVVSGESCCQKGASCCNGGACCKSKS